MRRMFFLNTDICISVSCAAGLFLESVTCDLIAFANESRFGYTTSPVSSWFTLRYLAPMRHLAMVIMGFGE
jgi:hypothetical protein